MVLIPIKYCNAKKEDPIIIILCIIKLFLKFQSNIGLIFHAVMEFDLSLKFLQKALELNIV